MATTPPAGMPTSRAIIIGASILAAVILLLIVVVIYQHEETQNSACAAWRADLDQAMEDSANLGEDTAGASDEEKARVLSERRSALNRALSGKPEGCESQD